MSEVVSGPASRLGRFTFLPADERQSLRVGRLLMAAGTSALVCVALAVSPGGTGSSSARIAAP